MKITRGVRLFFVLMAAVPLLAGCGGKKGPEGPPPMEAPVAPPLIKKIVDWDEYTGRFEASHRVEVRARVSGYIQSVNFEDGQMVKEGDVLFVIDQRPFKIALERAEADLKQARAVYQQAQNDFTRSKSLYESKAVSEEEFDQREQTMHAAAARVEAAQAALDQAKLELEFTEVKSPINGRVSRDLVHEGNLISGGSANATLLTTVVSFDPIYFYFEASEAEFLKYTRMSHKANDLGPTGSTSPVFVKLLDEKEFLHEGRLDFVDNELDFGTGTMQARAVFPNKDHIIEPGMFGRARLMGSPEYMATIVPDEVVGTDQSRKFVYVLGEGNTVEARTVELGPIHQTTFRVIREGLSPDDRVIIGNIQKIRPGAVVTPVPSEITRDEKAHGMTA